MSALSISMLGPFEASLNERPFTQFGTKSAQALLIYLACEEGRAHQRETLMTLLWPDMPLKSTQQNLRQSLYLLRKSIPDLPGKDGSTTVPLLIANRQTVRINPDADYCADIQTFAALIDTDPAQAISLYRGDFLADFFLPDSEPFETWAAARRAAYRHQVLLTLKDLTAVHLQQGRFAEATLLARQQLTIDNWRESSHRQLLEALARDGHRQEALVHYNDLCRLLEAELAVEPEGETTALIEKIRAGELAAVPTPRSEAASIAGEAALPRYNLLQPLTSFIGREEELDAITSLIAHNRLVILTGAGGIGKTNLSLQAARKLLAAFPGGVWLIELATIADPALIPKTAASALGLLESSDLPISETLIDFLQEKQCLLIIDNCEHLIDAAAQFVATLLQLCPDVKILASSRETLGVPGEMSFLVPPLSVPDVGQELMSDEWDQYDALSLFVERATAVLPKFQATTDNIPSLVKICQRLDGIPLAIELAAARVKMLTTDQIAARLDDRFRLLTGGSRTVLPRQQTLRGLIDWSWELLTRDEQELLRRLSVFAGGMTLDAVEAICAGDGLDSYELLDLLGELVNKSLVIARREQGQETRYRLLETIRQYAQERLEEAGQGEKFRDRHLRYFRQMGVEAEQALVGPDQAAWMSRLERELDNIRAALSLSLKTDIEAGLQLVSGMWHFWERGNVREGEAWLTKLMALGDSLKPDIRAKGLWVNGNFNVRLYNPDRALTLAQEGLAIYRELGDQQGIARCLHLSSFTLDPAEKRTSLEESLTLFKGIGDKLGIADVLQDLGFDYMNFNDYEPAAACLRESESLYRELGHLAGLANALSSFGHMAIWRGDYDSARPPLEESLKIEKQLGMEKSGVPLHNLGILHYRLGEYEQARLYLEQRLSISQQAGSRFASYWALVTLGYIFLRMGEFIQAQQAFLKSLLQFNEVDSLTGVVYTVEGLASLATCLGQSERAVRIFAWADAAREANQDPRPPIEQADVDRDTAVILETIDEETFAEAYAEGKIMTIDQAIGTAVAVEIS